MKNVYIYAYKMGSKSAEALADALDVYQIKHSGSKFRGSEYKTVINWGSSELSSEAQRCKVLNPPSRVSICTNKLTFFQAMTDAPESQRPRCVPWTVSESQVSEWLKAGNIVVARKSLTSHSGHGIIIIEPGQEIPKAPLYTKYIPKTFEFRIHIFRGEIVDVQRKIRDSNREPKNWKVRSHDNGFIFIRTGFDVPEDIREQSLKAFMATGLDFCSIDCVYNHGKAYVLEANTASGLEGTSVEIYANAFNKLLGG